MIFCFLEIPTEQLSPFHWVYYPEISHSFQRITEFGHFNAGMTREGDTGICAEIACFESDEAWKSSSAEIVERVKRDLAGTGLLKSMEDRLPGGTPELYTGAWYVLKNSSDINSRMPPVYAWSLKWTRPRSAQIAAFAMNA